MPRRLCALCCAVAFFLSGLPLLSESEPQPYEPNEFPRPLRDLRRFEIVTLGSVPLTLLFTSLGYRIFRSAGSGVTWRESGNFTPDDRSRVLTIGLSLSLGVGIADLLLGLLERRHSRESER